jgi:xylulokinase
MGAVGTGTVRDGVITMSMGTSGTLYGYSGRPIIDPEGILAAFCSSTGGWLPLLCTMNCTVATELTRELFGMNVKEIDAAGARAPAGAEGVAMLPFFNGERVPNLPRGKASIMGLNATNYSRENIARSSLESAVFGMKIGLDRFRELGFDTREIRMIGGGAKSAVWRQMAADVLGVPVLIPRQAEAAALGAALQACWMLDGGGEARLSRLIDEHVAIDTESSCEPVPALRCAYDEAYGRYRLFLDALAPLYR